RVGHCGDYGRRAGLAHPARWLPALDDVDIDHRCLVNAQDLVAIEVGLLNTAVFEGDVAIERGRDAEHDPALDLRPDGIRIDDGTTIDRAGDAAHTNRTVPRHFDFSNLRHVSLEGVLKRDAAGGPLRQRLSPAGFFCGKLK